MPRAWDLLGTQTQTTRGARSRRQGRSGLSKARLAKQGDGWPDRSCSTVSYTMLVLGDGLRGWVTGWNKAMLHAYSDGRYERRAQLPSHASSMMEPHDGL